MHDALFQGHQGRHDLDAASGTQEMPHHRLGGMDHQARLRVFAKAAFDGLGLAGIAQRRRGAVGVDELDLLGIHTRLLQGHAHGAVTAVAVGQRSRDVVGIGTLPKAGQFAVDLGAARLGVLQFFQHHHASAFAHDEAVASLVEGTRGCRGVVVASAHGLHVAESGIGQLANNSLGAAGDHGHGIAAANHLARLANGVVGGGAGRDDSHVGAAQAIFDGEVASQGVRDDDGDEEGGHALVAAAVQKPLLAGDGGKGADAGSQQHAEMVGNGLDLDARVVQRHLGGGMPEVLVAIQTGGHLVIDKKRHGVEVLHLSTDLGVVGGGIKESDRPDAALAGSQILPRGFHVVAQRIDGT